MIDKSGAGILRDIYGKHNPQHLYYNIDHLVKKTDSCIPSDDAVLNRNTALSVMSTIAHKSKFIEVDPSKDDHIVASKSYTIDSAFYYNGRIVKRTLPYKHSGDIDNDTANEIDRVQKNLYDGQFYESTTYPVHNFNLLDCGEIEDADSIHYDKLININSKNAFQYGGIGPICMSSPYNVPILQSCSDMNDDSIKDLLIKDLTVIYDDTKYDGMFRLMRCTIENDNQNSDCIKIMMCYMIKEHERYIQSTDKNLTMLIHIPRTIITSVYTIDHTLINNINNLIRFMVQKNQEKFLEAITDNNSSIARISSSEINVYTYLDCDEVCFYIYKLSTKKDPIYNSSWSGLVRLVRHFMRNFSQSKRDDIVDNIIEGRVDIWRYGNVFSGIDAYPCMTKTNLSILPFMATSLISNHNQINLTDAMYGFYVDFFESTFSSDMWSMPWIQDHHYRNYLKFKKQCISDNKCTERQYIRNAIMPMLESVMAHIAKSK